MDNPVATLEAGGTHLEWVEIISRLIPPPPPLPRGAGRLEERSFVINLMRALLSTILSPAIVVKLMVLRLRSSRCRLALMIRRYCSNPFPTVISVLVTRRIFTCADGIRSMDYNLQDKHFVNIGSLTDQGSE